MKLFVPGSASEESAKITRQVAYRGIGFDSPPLSASMRLWVRS